jgi:hypothetical protein
LHQQRTTALRDKRVGKSLVNNFSFFVRTRAQIVGIMSSTTRPWERRRIGERDVSLLWDVIVNNDDICFEHILPRLNRNEVKFLYGVNAETRALIKRSSRERELKWSFRVSEMLSISTLEIAWTNRSFKGSDWDETDFCSGVARTNKLELLQWIREEKKCAWDGKTSAVAAEQGNLEMVKYCVANRCPINASSCRNAARNGHLECLKYLHEDVKAPWDSETAYWAARNGHLHILEYLVEREYDEFDKYACSCAAYNGHLECLKYLHEVVKAPWDSITANWAALNGHLDILEYLVEREYDEFNESACANAAYNGHLECLKYLREVTEAPWDWRTASEAALNGHLHILEYLVERKYDRYFAYACANAAGNGHLNCLKYLHEVAKVPWDSRAVKKAHEHDSLQCLQYLLDNDCPLPGGWRYEDGRLRTPG